MKDKNELTNLLNLEKSKIQKLDEYITNMENETST